MCMPRMFKKSPATVSVPKEPNSGEQPFGHNEQIKLNYISILSFRRVLYVVYFLLGISPASEV